MGAAELLFNLVFLLIIVALAVAVVRFARRSPAADSASEIAELRQLLLDQRSAAAAAPADVAAPRASMDSAALAEARISAEALLAEARDKAAAITSHAQTEASTLTAAAHNDAVAVRRDAEAAATAAAADARAKADEDLRATRADLERREQRLAEREERLDAETSRVEARDRELASVEADIARQRAELEDVEAERRLILEQTAGMTAADAKAELVASIENSAKREAAVIVRGIESEAKETGEERARKIVTLAIQRVASAQTAESVVSVLHLPSDDMKGRIIGREGRNIRAYETITGVNLIIDDTPEAVLLSCFDPVRREVGRLTLEKLVLDGRIHPQRIEEMHEQSLVEVEALVTRAGEDALVEVGITDMHPELINLLGRLRYRTSYGQNVLRHLIEAAHLAGVMASELRLPPALIKRGTLLHDLGKALTHEVEGSHALIGAEIARKYGEDEEVCHAIEAHHNEVEPRTIGAVLTQASDSISGGRPGARRESLESYVKRLERIEEIATGQEGVEKVFAMQAGREIRVMVVPDQVDDIQAQVIARDVAKQIEEELTYPGQIRVTVVRESRAVEYAK
ncbi:MAG TPA: ribonuclease Y [Mycobacteriales bacterium]|nr:ribonuclease Y [Mycobacteriales bacterium]